MTATWISGGQVHVFEYPPRRPSESPEDYIERALAALKAEMESFPPDP